MSAKEDDEEMKEEVLPGFSTFDDYMKVILYIYMDLFKHEY